MGKGWCTRMVEKCFAAGGWGGAQWQDKKSKQNKKNEEMKKQNKKMKKRKNKTKKMKK